MADLKERYSQGKFALIIDSITPRGGPTYGTTTVTVRVEGLEQFVDVYPDPKCKYGTNERIVDGSYVKCTKAPLGFYDR